MIERAERVAFLPLAPKIQPKPPGTQPVRPAVRRSRRRRRKRRRRAGLCDEQHTAFPPDVALAYDTALKKPPQSTNFEQRWSAWASGYGCSASYNGNATVGSTNLRASDFGFAGGMNDHVTPTLVYGFALAGGGVNWNQAQNLGSGRSDALQASVFARSSWGPFYMHGSLAFANHWLATNRVAQGDQLRANFDGQSYAVRGEVGYRYAVTPMAGLTPYAALQSQLFHTPNYSETDLTGGGFGLTYNAQNATDTRSELGARADAGGHDNVVPLSAMCITGDVIMMSHIAL